MNEYGFDPKFILCSVVSIYLSFKDYKDFLTCVVKDERSFKIENFETVKSLKENEKIALDYEKYHHLIRLIEDLRNLYNLSKAEEVNIYIDIYNYIF
jgi:hypothetical protein